MSAGAYYIYFSTPHTTAYVAMLSTLAAAQHRLAVERRAYALTGEDDRAYYILNDKGNRVREKGEQVSA